MSTASSAPARCGSTRAGRRPTPGWRWATRCVCRRCAWPKPLPRARAGAGTRVHGAVRGRAPAGHRQARRRGRARRLRRGLRRHRAVAPRAARRRKFLELVHRLDKETSGVLLLAKKRSALTALQDQFRATGTPTSATPRWSSAPGRRTRRSSTWRCTRRSTPRASAMCARSLPTTPTAGARSRWSRWRRCFGRLHAARRDAEDRPHAPDPRAPRAMRATRSSATRSTATSRSTAQLARGEHRFAPHVPARAAAGVRPPGQRRAHHPRPRPASECATLLDAQHCVGPSSLTADDPAASTSSSSTGTARCSTRPR